jgi:hypothetical protein
MKQPSLSAVSLSRACSERLAAGDINGAVNSTTCFPTERRSSMR